MRKNPLNQLAISPGATRFSNASLAICGRKPSLKPAGADTDPLPESSVVVVGSSVVNMSGLRVGLPPFSKAGVARPRVSPTTRAASAETTNTAVSINWVRAVILQKRKERIQITFKLLLSRTPFERPPVYILTEKWP